MIDVRFDCALSQAQASSDFLVAQAERHEFEYFALALCQLKPTGRYVVGGLLIEFRLLHPSRLLQPNMRRHATVFLGNVAPQWWRRALAPTLYAGRSGASATSGGHTTSKRSRTTSVVLSSEKPSRAACRLK